MLLFFTYKIFVSIKAKWIVKFNYFKPNICYREKVVDQITYDRPYYIILLSMIAR